MCFRFNKVILLLLLTLFLVSCAGSNVIKYTGDRKDGKYHGQGTLTFEGMGKYEGVFKNGEMHGQGTLTFEGMGKYEGVFKNGKMHGKGTYSNVNGETSLIEFCNGIVTGGQGTLVNYVGETKEGKYHGQGTFTFAGMGKYEGEFKEGKYHGQGSYISGKDISLYYAPFKFKGVFKNGKMHGQGTLIIGEGINGEVTKYTIKYVGEFIDCNMHGQGTLTFEGMGIGEKYIGEFQDNMKNGQGITYYTNGEVWKGEWSNHAFIKGKKYAAGEYVEPAELYEEPIEEKIIVDKMDIGEAKLQCKDIGFTEGTESFGQCVLDLTK